MSPQKASWFRRIFGALFPQAQDASSLAAQTEKKTTEEELMAEAQAEEDLRVFFKRKALPPFENKLERDANGNWNPRGESDDILDDSNDILGGGGPLLGNFVGFLLSYHSLPDLSTQKQLYGADKDLRFFFEADCPEDDPLYWFAELQIPPDTQGGSLLDVKLVVPPSASLPYERLFFAFDDFAMSIVNNVASLTLDKFREQFKKGGVALLFSSEGETKFVESPGSLRLLNFEEFARRQELQSPEQASVAE